MYADIVRGREQTTLYATLAGKTPPDDGVDDDLQVASWPRGGDAWVRPRTPVAARDVDDVPGLTPPSWWRDDEEASQSFFRGVGVRPE